MSFVQRICNVQIKFSCAEPLYLSIESRLDLFSLYFCDICLCRMFYAPSEERVGLFLCILHNFIRYMNSRIFFYIELFKVYSNRKASEANSG